MLKKKWIIPMAVLVAALVFPVIAMAAGGPPPGRGRGSGYGEPVIDGDVTAEQEGALIEFWLDEHNALATYQAIMAQFGDAMPFAGIARAEQSHINALERIFARYDVETPAVPTVDVPVFETLEDACAAAAQAEIDNAALYDDFLSLFTQADILRVANNLQSASLNSHLSAFEACAEGEYEPGTLGTGSGNGAMGQGGMGGNGARGRGNASRGNVSRGNAQASQGNWMNSDACPLLQE